jgi:hypothetical protein
VEDLNNIIAYENAVMMNYYANYDKEKSEKLKAEHLDELFQNNLMSDAELMSQE